MRMALLPGGKKPQRMSDGAVGYDLFASLPDGPKVIHSKRWDFIPCGFKLELEPLLAFLICPKSGLARKNGITVLNGPGVGDPDFRGEYGAILINHSNVPLRVEQYMPVAQAIFVQVEIPDFEIVDEKMLSETIRGERGFGEMTGYELPPMDPTAWSGEEILVREG